MKASYLSPEARMSMQAKTFGSVQSYNFVNDGCWTGRADNSNMTKRVFVYVAPDKFYSPNGGRPNIGLCKPSASGKVIRVATNNRPK